uniref:BACK domain-containing protein n=1 Tax=Mesocestoides corti TaxID=53468 RepID=A0A5K3FX46_MESCO
MLRRGLFVLVMSPQFRFCDTLASVSQKHKTGKNDACQKMRFRLSEDSVDTFWSIANATMNRDLMRICVPLIAAKFDIFTARPVFYSSTDVEYLAFLLKSSQLTNVTEDSKLRVIATWFQTATTEDGGKCQIDCFKDLVESVDLNKVTLDVCANLCTSNLETGLSEECRGYLLSAWMSAKTSSSSTDVASSRRHAFRDYVVAYKLQPGVLMFEDILGETTDVNINFQVPSRRNCVVTFFK